MALDQPLSQCLGLAPEHSLGKVIESPYDLIVLLILEKIPQYLGSWTKIRIGCEEAFPRGVMGDGYAPNFAHQLGDFGEAHQVMAIVQGMELANVPVVRKKQPCGDLPDVTCVDPGN